MSTTSLIVLIGVIILVALAVWGVTQLLYAPERTVVPDASEILRRRYARGEITREEFEESRSTLD